MSYYSGLTERKDVLIVKHGLLTRKPCVRCPVQLAHVRGVRMGRCRTIQDTKWAQEVFREYLKKFISTKDNNEKKIEVK